MKESIPRYYINEDYFIFVPVVDGVVVEIGSGINEKYYKNSMTLDINNHYTPDIIGNGYKLPFKSNSIDLIIGLEVLEHLQTPEIFIHEIFRALKPTGQCFFTTRFIHPIHGTNDYYRYTADGLKFLFKSFKNTDINPHGGVLGCILNQLLVGRKLPEKYIRLIDYIDIKNNKICMGYSINGTK